MLKMSNTPQQPSDLNRLIIIWSIATSLFLSALFLLTTYKPPMVHMWVWIVGFVHLGTALFLRRHYFRSKINILCFEKWHLALIVLVGVQTADYLFVSHTIGPRNGATLAIINFFYFHIVIGFAEELWFRGLWLAMFKNRFITGVILGSIIFGLYHITHGLQTVIFTTFIGAMFAVARYRGTSILTLAMAHGLMDWFNLEMFPGASFRLSNTAILFLFPLLCLILAITLYYIPVNKGQQSVERKPL